MKQKLPGILVCLAIAVPSWLLGQYFEVVGGAVFAILIGMVISLVWKSKGMAAPGLVFTSKKILQLAVVLLGFGLNLVTIGRVGRISLPVILITIAVSLITSFILYKALHMPANSAVLIGVGSSICGGSAIAATAPVIGASDEEIAQSISVIFLFNIAAALIFPTLGGMLGLSNEGFAIFAGTAVNDTSSVTAAASIWDTLHNTGGTVLEYATIVKLTRTLAIIPITLVLGLLRTSGNRDGGKKVKIWSVFPVFILFFVLASVITTIITAMCTGEALVASNKLFSLLKQLSRFFIVMAMAGIGLNTNLVKLIKTGGKPICTGLSCWLAIACASLAVQKMLAIW